MVLASHIIFTCYGFWLPNDPRGSWSDFVRVWELLHFGHATKTDDRRSLAHSPHDRQRRLAAKGALRYPPVEFTGQQALHVAHGFAQAVQESSYHVYACSIMPKHVHLVAARHANPAERIAGHLKARAAQQLVEAHLHPFAAKKGTDGRFPSVWAHRRWKVFLDDGEDIARAIDYVNENPLKEGKKAQKWSFVSTWEGRR